MFEKFRNKIKISCKTALIITIILAVLIIIISHIDLSVTLTSKPDNAERPNQPMFIDPIADMKPGSGSWFITTNVTAGDQEFGLLTHHIALPFNNTTTTVAITDVTNSKYYADERKEGKIKETDEGFEVNSKNLLWTWSADKKSMSIKGQLESGEGSFDLVLIQKGPVLAYSGTGIWPLLDNASPTLEYAFPVMETTGTVTVNGQTYNVTGNSWYDRQVLSLMEKKLGSEPGNAHWTWLSISLSNGDVIAVWDVVGDRERCWANIMQPDGTLTIADVEPLSENAFEPWVSEKSGITWPSKYTLKIPGVETELLVEVTAPGQETVLDYNRMEGVIHVTGTYKGQEVTGVGYAEIIGDPQLNK
ncbi:lipocalin-like domain-containing protein [Fusibacter sp. 3D3]|uniref:lipocalin-like domain-containing protein n=1 Tax=Fusibacter sp. 3D3 TaxID=1048380 RepID=UPI000853DA4B|nr:lipocalin-like domain-containing protein [Fusibacter sp. 3D3]GAU75964.1 AttH component of AttEFGH ABC transport system [Fusibacter sp. 3D3]